MQKEMVVIVLGVWLVVLPYLGIPHSSAVFTALVCFSGLAVLAVGLLLRSEVLAKGNRHSPHSSYVESLPAQAGVPPHHDDTTRMSLDYTDEDRTGINSLN